MWQSYAMLRPPQQPKKLCDYHLDEEEARRLLERSGRALVTLPPAQEDDDVATIDTPALVVDMDAMERNLQRMAWFCRQHHLQHRPNIKTHKTIQIAHRQMELGAVGVSCQKVSEAEVMVRLGNIPDVLVTGPVVGLRKVTRLVKLAREAPRVGVCVDDEKNAQLIAEVCVRERVEVDVYLSVDVGGATGGLTSPEHAVRLGRAVWAMRGLNLMGLHVHHSPAQHLTDPLERREAVMGQAVPLVRAMRDALLANALSCPVVTGGGTGTFHWASVSGVFTEIQAGAYVFMDGEYAQNLRAKGEPHFEHSLFVLTTVQGRCSSGGGGQRGMGGLVVDAGYKALGLTTEGGGLLLPSVLNPRAMAGLPPGLLAYHHPCDERGLVSLRRPTAPPAREEEPTTSSSSTGALPANQTGNSKQQQEEKQTKQQKEEEEGQKQGCCSDAKGRAQRKKTNQQPSRRPRQEEEEEQGQTDEETTGPRPGPPEEEEGADRTGAGGRPEGGQDEEEEDATSLASTATCTTINTTTTTPRGSRRQQQQSGGPTHEDEEEAEEEEAASSSSHDLATTPSSSKRRTTAAAPGPSPPSSSSQRGGGSQQTVRQRAVRVLGKLVGSKLVLVPGRCDATVNLHDWLVGVRGSKVEAVMRVAARGAVF